MNKLKTLIQMLNEVYLDRNKDDIISDLKLYFYFDVSRETSKDHDGVVIITLNSILFNGNLNLSFYEDKLISVD